MSSKGKPAQINCKQTPGDKTLWQTNRSLNLGSTVPHRDRKNLLLILRHTRGLFFTYAPQLCHFLKSGLGKKETSSIASCPLCNLLALVNYRAPGNRKSCRRLGLGNQDSSATNTATTTQFEDLGSCPTVRARACKVWFKPLCPHNPP